MKLGKIGHKIFNFIMCPVRWKLFFSLPGQMVIKFFWIPGKMLKKFFTLGSAGKPLFFSFFPRTPAVFLFFLFLREEGRIFNFFVQRKKIK